MRLNFLYLEPYVPYYEVNFSTPCSILLEINSWYGRYTCTSNIMNYSCLVQHVLIYTNVASVSNSRH